jgi:MFS family permease
MGLPVFAPVLMQAAEMRPEAYGWVGGAAGLGSVWLYKANRAFTSALGPVHSVLVAMAVAVTGALLIATGSFTLMLLGAFMVGFGYATTTPAGSQILADHTPRELRGTLFSLRQAGVPLGGVIAGAAGSWLVANTGWRTALAGIAGLCVVLTLPLLFAPRRFNESRPRPAFRFGLMLSGTNLLEPFRTVTAAPGLARMSAAAIGFATVQGTVNAFFVTYATAGLGFSLTLAGTLFATMQAASVAGRVVLGFLADWLGSPRPVLRALSVMSSLSALLLASLAADWPRAGLFAALLFVGLSISTWNGLYLAEVANLAPDSVGEATAGTTFFVFATYMLTPPLAGLVIAFFGYGWAFALAAAAALVSGAVLAAPRRTGSG